MGGALKNVLAIGCGISDGVGYGHNSRAALITRGARVPAGGRAGGQAGRRAAGRAGVRVRRQAHNAADARPACSRRSSAAPACSPKNAHTRTQRHTAPLTAAAPPLRPAGLAEVTSIVTAMGGSPLTMLGLGGIGDLGAPPPLPRGPSPFELARPTDQP